MKAHKHDAWKMHWLPFERLLSHSNSHIENHLSLDISLCSHLAAIPWSSQDDMAAFASFVLIWNLLLSIAVCHLQKLCWSWYMLSEVCPNHARERVPANRHLDVALAVLIAVPLLMLPSAITTLAFASVAAYRICLR